MNPTTYQQKVIDSTEPDILVEAGAGSGKTTTIVNRYVRLISKAGYEPHQILAITFTDKAAGDLRRKVREARHEIAEEAEKARRKMSESTGNGMTGDGDAANPRAISMSSSWIGTYHSICSRILKAYPVEAGVDPAFTVIDDITAETLRGRAFTEALDRFLAEEPESDRRELLVGQLTERTLRRTVFDTFDELRSRGMERPKFPDFPDTPYPTAKIEYLRGDVGRVKELKGHHHTHRPKIEKLELLLDEAGRELRYDELAPLRFGSGKEDRAEFCETLSEVVAELAARENGDFARRAVGRLLELFSDNFTGLKSRRSLLDYEDLQLTALRLLRNPRYSRIQTAYRARFCEIMVDEYQDTNRLQRDLVEELRGEETTLLTVGDEMQSIYGFRHADITLFRARRNKLEEKNRFSLLENFRSQPEVIAAVNEIGLTLDRQIGGRAGSSAEQTRHEFKELTVGRVDPETPGSVTAILTGHDGWGPLDLGPLAPPITNRDQDSNGDEGKKKTKTTEVHFNEAEALKLAHHLRQLVDSGEVEQKDIAILLRAKTRSDLYVNALRQVGLSPYLTAGSGFWQSREAIDVRSLLSIIANPLEDDALLGVLASPACGLSSDALWLLRRASPPYSPLWPTLGAAAGGPLPEGGTEKWLKLISPEDRDLITALTETVDRLRATAASLPLASLVEQVVSATGYDLADLTWDDTRNGLANIRRIASLAHEYEAAEGRDLRGFIEWTRLSESLNRESPAATEEEDSEVTRIMTVHAAKGLQFKVVCVPDCGRQLKDNHTIPVRLSKAGRTDDPADFEVGLRTKSPDGTEFELFDWPELKQQAKCEDEDEELRLLHVAMTRAEDRLILSGVLPTRPDPKMSESLDMIGRFMVGFGLDPTEPDGWPPSVPEGPEPDAEISVVPNFASKEAAASLRASHPLREGSARILPGTPPLRRPEARVFPSVPLSFTAISEYDECPTRFFAGRILHLEAPSRRGLDGGGQDPEQETLTRRDHGTRFGSAVHDVLESLGRSRWPRLKDETLKQALKRRGADPETGVDLAREMIEGFRASSLGQRIKAGPASFEAPLLVRVGDITIRGFADVLLDGPVPLVLDYKTNRLDGKSPREKMSDYVQQRNLYALAVARFHGCYTVETAFVFLADPEGPVTLTLGAEELDRAEAELESSLDDIAAGRFFTRTESGRAPCGECWACEMLTGRIAGRAAA